jgi:hypothetical protein
MKSMVWDVAQQSTDVSKEHITSGFRIEEEVKAINQQHVACFSQVSCFVYSLVLKMEAVCSSKTSVDFYGTTRSYIPEDCNLRQNVNLALSWLMCSEK